MKKIYQLLSICVLFFGIPSNLNAQCSTASIVPYYEGFSSISTNNQLPVCWAASNLANTCLTYTSPTKYAAFFDSPTGVNHFYTNGLQLNAGVTYSAAVWHRVSAAQANWTDLSILVGPNQGPLGLISVVSSNGPVANTTYAVLSGTFTVGTTGIYHVAVRGTSNASLSNYLQWDDLSITIPCGPGSGNNTPNLSIAGSNTLCEGSAQSIYTVSGANMYNWNTGANTNTVMPLPSTPGLFMLSVQGTNVFSGCVSSASINIAVSPAPILQASASLATVCPGQVTTLNALGNPATFSWSTGSASPNTTVAPTQATNYTVTGTSSSGCKTSAVLSVQVFSAPTITASANYTSTCADNEVIFTASGASSYTWMAPGGPTTFFNPFIPAILYNGTYTVVGKDANGCRDTTTLLMSVFDCTGIESFNSNSLNLFVYPNPGAGNFFLETNGLTNLNFEVQDLAGRNILTTFNEDPTGRIDFTLENSTPGLYFLKIKNGNKLQVIKIIKE